MWLFDECLITVTAPGSCRMEGRGLRGDLTALCCAPRRGMGRQALVSFSEW